jgi:hypothetical protein
MVITSDANLIVYHQGHHQVQPFLPNNTVMPPQGSVRHFHPYEQTPSDKMTTASQNANRYNSSQFLHYADDYQIGCLIDLYA